MGRRKTVILNSVLHLFVFWALRNFSPSFIQCSYLIDTKKALLKNESKTKFSNKETNCLHKDVNQA